MSLIDLFIKSLIQSFDKHKEDYINKPFDNIYDKVVENYNKDTNFLLSISNDIRSLNLRKVSFTNLYTYYDFSKGDKMKLLSKSYLIKTKVDINDFNFRYKILVPVTENKELNDLVKSLWNKDNLNEFLIYDFWKTFRDIFIFKSKYQKISIKWLSKLC